MNDQELIEQFTDFASGSHIVMNPETNRHPITLVFLEGEEKAIQPGERFDFSTRDRNIKVKIVRVAGDRLPMFFQPAQVIAVKKGNREK